MFWIYVLYENKAYTDEVLVIYVLLGALIGRIIEFRVHMKTTVEGSNILKNNQKKRRIPKVIWVNMHFAGKRRTRWYQIFYPSWGYVTEKKAKECSAHVL